ncbi:hypothetical protein MD484_g3680, partial [Candolleomyces efflorescens]
MYAALVVSSSSNSKKQDGRRIEYESAEFAVGDDGGVEETAAASGRDGCEEAVTYRPCARATAAIDTPTPTTPTTGVIRTTTEEKAPAPTIESYVPTRLVVVRGLDEWRVGAIRWCSISISVVVVVVVSVPPAATDTTATVWYTPESFFASAPTTTVDTGTGTDAGCDADAGVEAVTADSACAFGRTGRGGGCVGLWYRLNCEYEYEYEYEYGV